MQGDNEVEVVRFLLPRYTGSGKDLAKGIAYIGYAPHNGDPGAVYIPEENRQATEDQVILTWLVGSQTTAQPGVMTIQVKISDLEGVLWNSEKFMATVGDSIQVESPQAPMVFRSRGNVTDISGMLRTANPDTEPPITIAERAINIPAELQNIAVQNDRNSETVKIVCPRYFDGHDLSVYSFYLRTTNSGGYDPVLLTPEVSGSLLNMWWTLKPPQTSYEGRLTIQLWVTGIDFDWQTSEASVNIIRQVAGEPIIPVTPPVMDEFLKQISEVANRAKASETNAGQSATDAAGSATAAAQSAADALDSKNAAAGSATAADASATAAKASETNAAASASGADVSARAAQASKESAEASATAAAGSAEAALASEQEAKASETASQASATAAEAARDAALAAQTAAETGAADAGQSADDAAASALAAQAGATSAKASETASKTSETNAAGSAATAKTEADRAKSEADRASSIVTGNQGWYATPEALRAAHPTGQNGWYAIVGTTDTFWTWDGDTSAWVDTGNSSATSNYEDLTNKPSIGGVELKGNKSPADLGAVPVGRTINGKPLTGDITLMAADVGADAAGAAATVAESLENLKADKASNATAGNLAALDVTGNLTDSGLTPAGIVQKRETVGVAIQSAPLAADGFVKVRIDPGAESPVLRAEDIGARPDTWTPTAAEVGADPAGAARKVQENLDAHAADREIHVTAAKQAAWDAKAAHASVAAATLTAAGWTGEAAPFTQSVAASGVTADAAQVVEVGLADSATQAQREAARAAMLSPTGKAANSVTVTADGEKPTVDLPVTVVIFG